MPCYDGRDDYNRGSAAIYAEQEAEAERKRARQLMAIVCAALKVDPKLFKKIDWKEAGVKRAWAERVMREHELQDKLRRARAAQRRAEKKARKSALAKLTKLERKLLNLDD
jgi:hypothetical protein